MLRYGRRRSAMAERRRPSQDGNSTIADGSIAACLARRSRSCARSDEIVKELSALYSEADEIVDACIDRVSETAPRKIDMTKALELARNALKETNR